MQAPGPGLHSSLESSIDKSPYVNIMEDGMVAAVSNDAAENKDSTEDQTTHETKPEDFSAAVGEQHETGIEASTNSNHCTLNSLGEKEEGEAKIVDEAIAPLRRSVDQLSRRHGRSMWLFAYIAVVSSWPLLGSVLFVVFRKKFMNLGWFKR